MSEHEEPWESVPVYGYSCEEALTDLRTRMSRLLEAARALVTGEQGDDEPWWGYLDDGFLMCCIGCGAVERRYSWTTIPPTPEPTFADLAHDEDCPAMRLDAAVTGEKR